MGRTAISWASHTHNTQAGCTKRSEACLNCYALSMSVRLLNMGGPERYVGVTNGDLENPQWTGVLNWSPQEMERLFQGLEAAIKPRRVFLNSMTDTFHEDADPDALVALAKGIPRIPKRHALMLLTKREEIMLAWQQHFFPKGLPPNVWTGVTIENQRRANERLNTLVKIKSHLRFVSMEPLVGAVDLRPWIGRWEMCSHCGEASDPDEGTEKDICPKCGAEGFLVSLWGDHQVDAYRTGLRYYEGDENALEWHDGPDIGWVITGGESGNKAKPSQPGWFRQLRDQCAQAGIPFHHKQHGEWAEVIGKPQRGDVWVREGKIIQDWRPVNPLDPADLPQKGAAPGRWDPFGDALMRRVGKKEAGALLDGALHDDVPRVRGMEYIDVAA